MTHQHRTIALVFCAPILLAACSTPRSPREIFAAAHEADESSTWWPVFYQGAADDHPWRGTGYASGSHVAHVWIAGATEPEPVGAWSDPTTPGGEPTFTFAEVAENILACNAYPCALEFASDALTVWLSGDTIDAGTFTLGTRMQKTCVGGGDEDYDSPDDVWMRRLKADGTVGGQVVSGVYGPVGSIDYYTTGFYLRDPVASLASNVVPGQLPAWTSDCASEGY